MAEDMIEVEPCDTCGGSGSGPPVLVCCNNYRMGRHGEPICCDNPVYAADGYCSDCGGSGGVKQQAPQELRDVLSDALAQGEQR